MSHATTPVSAHLAARLRRELRVLLREVTRALDGSREGVHQARVASRRVREMLAVAAAATDGEARALARDVRRVGRVLGPIREIDVSRDLWLEHARQGRWPARIVMRLERAAAAERDRLEPEMRATLDRILHSNVRRRLAGLAAALIDQPQERLLRQALDKSAAERAATAAAAVEAAGTVYAAEPLHAVRIAAKKLRYVLELARDLAGVRLDEPIAVLKAEQDLLGGLHDLQVIQGRLQAMATERHVSQEDLRRQKETWVAIERECRALHASYVSGTPAFLETLTASRAAVMAELGRPPAHRMAPRLPHARDADPKASGA